MRRNIPSALRQQVWIKYNGEVFKSKCTVKWCKNIITPFNFEAGHNIPFSKGGKNTIDNLKPICGACNKSMSDKYTIDEFSSLAENTIEKKQKFLFFKFKFSCCLPID
jgi:hypothetical protein